MWYSHTSVTPTGDHLFLPIIELVSMTSTKVEKEQIREEEVPTSETEQTAFSQYNFEKERKVK